MTAGADPEQLRLGRSAQQLRQAVAQVFYAADEEQRRKVRELLDETRRKVYAVLAADD